MSMASRNIRCFLCRRKKILALNRNNATINNNFLFSFYYSRVSLRVYTVQLNVTSSGPGPAPAAY